MITEAICNFLWINPINSMLDKFEGIIISIPEGIFDKLSSIFGMLGFVFPVSGLLVILSISLSIGVFKIIWSLIIRIKSFIPTMGS